MLSSVKRAEELNRHFSKEDIQMVNKHMERGLTSLLIREIQIKTTKRYYFISVGMVVITQSTSNKRWRGCGDIPLAGLMSSADVPKASGKTDVK